jgi:hypothetical protein
MTTDWWLARLITDVVAVALGVATIAGCAADNGAAQTAITAAEAAINSVMAEASAYVPDQAQSLKTALSSAKEKLDKGDYTAAAGDAKTLAAKAKDVAGAATAKKAELTQSWTKLSVGVPKVVDRIKERVDILSQSKTLPADVTPQTLAAAKSGLGEITEQWTAATAAYKDGNLADAMAKGGSVKTKAAEVLTMLGMRVPDVLKT